MSLAVKLGFEIMKNFENQASLGMWIVWDMIFTPFLSPNSPLDPLSCQERGSAR